MAAAVGGGMQAVEEALFNMKLADVKTVRGGQGRARGGMGARRVKKERGGEEGREEATSGGEGTVTR